MSVASLKGGEGLSIMSSRFRHPGVFQLGGLGVALASTACGLTTVSVGVTSGYSPTTTVSALTAVNTSASPAFTDDYYSYITGVAGANANGDGVPANISKISIRTLLSGGAANAKIFAFTQDWFCHSASNESGGKLIAGTTAGTPSCGSHIDIGYNSGDASQVAATVTDMESRGIQGAIIDWEGPPVLSTGQVNVQNNEAVDQFRAQAEASSGQFSFAVVEDEGVGGCAKGWWPCQCMTGTCPSGTTGTPTTEAVFDINYALNRWAGSPAYLHSNERPVVYVFGLDTYATLNWSTIGSNLGKDPVTGQSPLLLFENAPGMTHADTGGAYSWVTPTAWTSYPGSDPFSLNYLSYTLGQFIDSLETTPSLLVTATAFKGFDDTVVNGWGSGSRYADQQCGKTWLQSVAAVNSSFASRTLDTFAVPTWDDYEEATEVETGIDNCLTALSPAVSGNVVSWTPSFGQSIDGYSGDESTIHHYAIYVSQDGANLMALPTTVASGTHRLDLSQFGLPAGTYRVFVQAVGQPMIRNTLAEAQASFTASAP